MASALSTCERPAANRDSDCATSVRVTSPTLKRSRVWRNCSCNTSTLRRCRSRIAVSRNRFMYAVTAESSTACSDTRKVSRAACTWLSAWRVRLAV